MGNDVCPQHTAEDMREELQRIGVMMANGLFRSIPEDSQDGIDRREADREREWKTA